MQTRNELHLHTCSIPSPGTYHRDTLRHLAIINYDDALLRSTLIRLFALPFSNAHLTVQFIYSLFPFFSFFFFFFFFRRSFVTSPRRSPSPPIPPTPHAYQLHTPYLIMSLMPTESHFSPTIIIFSYSFSALVNQTLF
jgi:hypothetical protein